MFCLERVFLSTLEASIDAPDVAVQVRFSTLPAMSMQAPDVADAASDATRAHVTSMSAPDVQSSSAAAAERLAMSISAPDVQWAEMDWQLIEAMSMWPRMCSAG